MFLIFVIYMYIMGNIRTIGFTETKEILKSLCSSKKVGENFNEFIMSYVASASKLFDVINKATSHSGITDFTEEVMKREDQWLFSPGSDTTIEIVLRHLNNLNNGDGNNSMPTWCFVDSGKKTVVHFVRKKEWYAEIFIFDHVESSYLHLISEGGKNLISVTFTSEMAGPYSHVATAGGHFLRDYLPREKMDILGKGKCGRCQKVSSLKKQHKFASKDEGDKL